MTCSINGLIHKIKSTKHAMQLFKVEKYIKEKFQKKIKFFTIVLKMLNTDTQNTYEMHMGIVKK